MPSPPRSADLSIVEGWLRARSVARTLPEPVRDLGGLRMDTDLPTERRRHVFAAPLEGLRALGESVAEPLVFLKLCGSLEQLAALLPARWELQPLSFMMTTRGDHRSPPLPPGWRLDVTTEGAVSTARISTPDGQLAASGHAAEGDGVFIYDRIRTDPDFRRQGLGSVVMGALSDVRRSRSALQVLVATAEGRALYARLGWSLYSPYATAVIPAGG